jgi:RNAse (barnase) inhibitor barstar
MQTINLSGKNWRTKQDFYNALADALGSVEWHGRNADAFLETMIYHVELNRVQPPYRVVISDPSDYIRDFLSDFASWVEEARNERKTDPDWAGDVDVAVLVS